MFTWQSWEEGETGQGAAGNCTPSNPRPDHTSHGSQVEAHIHSHKHRQVDKQAHPRAGQQHSGGTDWLLPASLWGDPHLPRIPQPGQTMSRGGCGEPTG